MKNFFVSIFFIILFTSNLIVNMEARGVDTTAVQEWDYVTKYKLTGPEGPVSIHFTTRASLPIIFQMPEIVEMILPYLEEDPIDALYFAEALTTSHTTRAVCGKEKDLCIVYMDTPSYVNWLDRVGAYRNYRINNQGEEKKLKAPIYSYGETDEEYAFHQFPELKEWRFYENRTDYLGMPCYFKMFAHHWIKLWIKNAPVESKTSIGWENLRAEGVDYFFYRFGETLGVFRLLENHGLNPYKIANNGNTKSINSWACVDCLRQLDIESCSFNTGKYFFKDTCQEDLILASAVKAGNGRGHYYMGSSVAPNIADLNHRSVLTGDYFRNNTRKCNAEEYCACSAQLRCIPNRCISCIHKRWELVDMYDAWGMIEESFRDTNSYKMEIPHELATFRMMPDMVDKLGKNGSIGSQLVTKTFEQRVPFNNVGKYIEEVSKWFMKAPKKYGVRVDKEEADSMINEVTKMSREDRVKLIFYMRLLTLLPLKNFFVGDEFFQERMGFKDFEEYDNAADPMPFFPWPLNMSLVIGTENAICRRMRNARSFIAGKCSFYLRNGRAHAMTYAFKEDVDWIIRKAKMFIEIPKPVEELTYNWWDRWMTSVIRKLYGFEHTANRAISSSLIKALDQTPNLKYLQGGFALEGFSRHVNPRPFRYRGWFGCLGTLDASAPFWTEYNPHMIRQPLKYDEVTLKCLGLCNDMQKYVSVPFRAPEFYATKVVDIPVIGTRYPIEWKSHLKKYRNYMGRNEDEGHSARVRRMLGDLKAPKDKAFRIVPLDRMHEENVMDWALKTTVKIPDVSTMRKEITPGLKKFMEEKTKVINSMVSGDGQLCNRESTPNTVWQAQLVRLDYCAFHSGILIDWSKADPKKMRWGWIKRKYQSILRTIKYSNKRIENGTLSKETKKVIKKRRREEKKEKKSSPKKIKREEKDIEDMDMQEFVERISKNPALEMFLEFIEREKEKEK